MKILVQTINSVGHRPTEWRIGYYFLTVGRCPTLLITPFQGYNLFFYHFIKLPNKQKKTSPHKIISKNTRYLVLNYV